MFVGALILNTYLFFSGNVLIWFVLIEILFFITTPFLHYFYIGLDTKRIIFHNPYLFSWRKAYHYEDILKVRIWHPLDKGQILGFRVFTKQGSFNYYSAGLVSLSDCQNIVDFLLNHNVNVEIINPNKTTK